MADNFFKDSFHSNQDHRPDDKKPDASISVDGREYQVVFEDSEIKAPTASDIDVFHSRQIIRIEQ